MKTKIVIFGAAGTGLIMAEEVEKNINMQFFGFLDDEKEKQSKGYCGYPVLGGLSAWDSVSQDCLFLSSLYGPKKNELFSNMIKYLKIPPERWTNLISEAALVSKKCKVGFGTYVGPGVILNPEVRVGNYCALMANAWIGHHSKIGNYVFLSNSLSLSGGVAVGDGSYLGSNATIREYAKIGSYVTVGMGSVVVKDINSHEIVVGNPARKI
jgi:sugar O-acyltransferase (sialic acid O-acetyltransferase NeuD family)